ncbi:hypothetical protein LTR62_005280 [Meristemomyces frigidus]|uniref:Cytochrome P450 n=1 Tax=Meristemomyces frigidus TaxID=1508187 RepID=A0AAN7TDM9_9PEZI|nr:hypothetical protein LTR62_005280 [Meristemomyces frigidus]
MDAFRISTDNTARPTDNLLLLVISASFLTLIYLFWSQATRSNIPEVAGISKVPGSWPFIGDLWSLGGRTGENDSSVYTQWSHQLGTDVFQMRLGDQRTLVANSFLAIKELWVGHANDLIHRPFQHGFADKLEYDLSGAAMTEPIRRCRKAAMRALGKPMWSGYYPLLEPSSVKLVQNNFRAGANGADFIDIYPELRRVVFDLTLSLTYGYRMTSENNDFVVKLIESINRISNIRSSTQRFRDYTPALRFLIPDTLSSNVIVSSEKIRQAHLETIYANLQRRLAEGEDVNCIVTGLVNDKLSLPESHGVCKALLQAAPDSTASSIYMAIAWLCSPAGRAHQATLFAAIKDAYGGDGDQAWNMAFREESVPLVVAFYKEILRYWTITPFATPRSTANAFKYRNSLIPKGVTMIMNAQHGNHDRSWYGDTAEMFNPTSAMLVRLILAFEMRESEEAHARKPNLDMVDFSDVRDSLVAMPRYFDCHYIARDPQWLASKWDA